MQNKSIEKNKTIVAVKRRVPLFGVFIVLLLLLLYTNESVLCTLNFKQIACK